MEGEVARESGLVIPMVMIEPEQRSQVVTLNCRIQVDTVIKMSTRVGVAAKGP